MKKILYSMLLACAPLSAQIPQIPGSTILGNASSSASAPQALNPLGTVILQSAVMKVTALANANLTLSGNQTIDGVAVTTGQAVVLIAQTTHSQNGIWIVQAGAWTRPINFPSGYVIAQNCNIAVLVDLGTRFQGYHASLVTSAGTVTIDTTSQTWAANSLANATTTSLGVVTRTTANQAGSTTGSVIIPESAGAVTAGDCPEFVDANGSIDDPLNINGTFTGSCALNDANNHLNVSTAGAANTPTAPTITGTGCTASGTIYDNSGAVVAAGADTCTITFGSAFTNTPHCALAGYNTTALPTISTAPTTAAVVVHTAAAGTFAYVCL